MVSNSSPTNKWQVDSFFFFIFLKTWTQLTFSPCNLLDHYRLFLAAHRAWSTIDAHLRSRNLSVDLLQLTLVALDKVEVSTFHKFTNSISTDITSSSSNWIKDNRVATFVIGFGCLD